MVFDRARNRSAGDEILNGRSAPAQKMVDLQLRRRPGLEDSPGVVGAGKSVESGGASVASKRAVGPQ